jgi:hypothetical protein
MEQATPTEIANLLVNLPKHLRDYAVKSKFPIADHATLIKLRLESKSHLISLLSDQYAHSLPQGEAWEGPPIEPYPGFPDNL